MYPAAVVNYPNQVLPGDSMSASVSVSGDTYKLVLADQTQGWTETTTKTEYGLSNSSAEVITEAPCCQSDGNPYPLADFGTVNYSGSQVDGSSMAAQDPTPMVIVNPLDGQPEDTTSPMNSSGDFSNTWKAAN